jgi:hypothetical protein
MPLYNQSRFSGASQSLGGASGNVPIATAGKNKRALLSDGGFGETTLFKYKTQGIVPVFCAGNSLGLGFSGTVTDKLRYFSVVLMPADGNIDEIIFQVDTAPAVAFNVHIGLWDFSDIGEPLNLLASGTASSGIVNSTQISFSITPVFIKRGIYFLSFTPSGTALGGIRFANNSSQALVRQPLGVDSLGLNTGKAFSYTCSTFDQASHESFVLTTDATPMIGIRYA